jgi:hypothetical protein
VLHLAVALQQETKDKAKLFFIITIIIITIITMHSLVLHGSYVI